MALRKKGLKVAVTAMAIISVITSGGLNFFCLNLFLV